MEPGAHGREPADPPQPGGPAAAGRAVRGGGFPGEPGFPGHNRYADGTTSTVTCVVTEAVRPSAFARAVLDGGDVSRPCAVWRCALEPDDAPGRTRVAQSFVHGPGESGARAAARREPTTPPRRLDVLRAHMTATLKATETAAGAAGVAEEGR